MADTDEESGAPPPGRTNTSPQLSSLLGDLLQESRRDAERERAEIEAALRQREEDEKRQKAEEEARKREELRKRTEEEARRRQDLLRKRAERLRAQKEPEIAPSAEAAQMAAAQAMPVPAPRRTGLYVGAGVAVAVAIAAGVFTYRNLEMTRTAFAAARDVLQVRTAEALVSANKAAEEANRLLLQQENDRKEAALRKEIEEKARLAEEAGKRAETLEAEKQALEAAAADAAKKKGGGAKKTGEDKGGQKIIKINTDVFNSGKIK